MGLKRKIEKRDRGVQADGLQKWVTYVLDDVNEQRAIDEVKAELFKIVQPLLDVTGTPTDGLTQARTMVATLDVLVICFLVMGISPLRAAEMTSENVRRRLSMIEANMKARTVQ